MARAKSQRYVAVQHEHSDVYGKALRLKREIEDMPLNSPEAYEELAVKVREYNKTAARVNALADEYKTLAKAHNDEILNLFG